MTEAALRQAIVDACRTMNATGLNQGMSGNISVRCGGNDADHSERDTV